MKLEYFDTKLDHLPMNQFIPKYELLIPIQKKAYLQELPDKFRYREERALRGLISYKEPYYDLVLIDREETNDELIVENFTPTNLEDEEEYKRCCEWSFDYQLTDKERSHLLYAGINNGTIRLVYEHEADTISETPEDLIHEYSY